MSILKEELSRLKPELERVISENSKLVQDLRETVENQIGGTSDGEFSPSNDQEQALHNLQMQVESALQVRKTDNMLTVSQCRLKILGILFQFCRIKILFIGTFVSIIDISK